MSLKDKTNRKKATKTLIILIGLLLIGIVSVIAVEVWNPARVTKKNVFHGVGTPHIYCVEQGTQFPKNGASYTSSAEYEVQDHVLEYILNLSDLDTHLIETNTESDMKQNLIWRYLKIAETNPSNIDANFIKNNGRNNGIKWPTARSMDYNVTQTEWNNAQNYANKFNNTNVKIDNLKIEAGALKVSISGNYDKYVLEINSKEYKSGGEQSTTISIPLTEIDGGTANVTVRAFRTRYKAYIKVWHSTSKTSQKLIEITHEAKENIAEEELAKAERSIPINVNVSLQKYITQVNGKNLSTEDLSKEEQESFIHRKNMYRKDQNNPVAEKEKDNMKDLYKSSNVVNIEPGDTVTYKIHIYNNSDVTANQVIIHDELPICAGKYSINNGKFIELGENKEFDYTINNLPGGAEIVLTVKVYFNSYYAGIQNNTASIKIENQHNDTIYRTEDADYVQMRKYEVSLEKYVSKINGADNGKQIDLNNYENIIKYLSKYKEEEIIELRDIINNLLKIDKESINVNSYDLHRDGKVDEEDINYYLSIKNMNVEEIKSYIEADINKDGKVDNNDLNIYKMKRADLNGDNQLNEYDRYAFSLAQLYKQSQDLINDDILNYLYVKKLLLKENKNYELALQEFEQYIKSDVNEDGIVNEKDNYMVDRNNNKLNIRDKEYDLRVEKIEQIQNNSISELKKYLDMFDANGDTIVNQEDNNIFRNYADKENEEGIYFAINKLDQEEKLEDFKEKFLEAFNKKLNDNNNDIKAEYDMDMDNHLDFTDYILYKEDSDITQNDLDRLEEIFTLKDFSLDLNGDQIANYEDYKILIEYNNMREKDNIYEGDTTYNISDIVSNNEILNLINNCSIIVDDKEENKDFREEDINAIKVYKSLKEFKPQYNIDAKETSFQSSLYDINDDNFINENDKKIIEEWQNRENSTQFASARTILNSVLNNNDIEKFIEVFKETKESTSLVSNLNIDYNEFKIDYPTQSDEEILNNIIKEFQNKSTTISLMDYTLKDVSYEFLYYQMQKDVKSLDINQDGVVNETDCQLNNENVSSIESEQDIKSFINNNDIDQDGDCDEDDEKLLKEINKLKGVIPKDFQEEIKTAMIVLVKNNVNTQADTEDRVGHAEYLTRTNDGLEDRTENDEQWTRHNTDKYDNVVAVEKGDEVTYTIKVRNDGKTNVYISQITDYLPDGVAYNDIDYIGTQYNITTDNVATFSNLSGKLLIPGDSASFTITVRVIESNMSINILKNTAKITKITNKNNLTFNADEADSTPYNNEDSDYIQLRDITIAGNVWNDKALDKVQNNYNGKYDEGQENKLNGIKVQLYRVGTGVVAETLTDSKGNYSFAGNYIKASKCDKENSDWDTKNKNYQRRWKEYYSYYIVFEYDGITYTSTTDGKTCIDITDTTAYSNEEYKINSNAKEDNGPVKETRKSFNDRFSKVDNTGASKLDGSEKTSIAYDTKNEKEYIPQSNHRYNPETMAMQSSTNQINIGSGVTENQLQHINLGLRGRDIFDLELTSDVHSTKVTVNGQDGEYKYSDNKVTVRRTDLYSEPQDSDKYYYDNKPVAKQDAANIYSTESKYNDEEDTNSYVQKVRDTDISVEKANEKANEEGKYNSTGLGIEVTYKITVTNASQTQGTASKIINYFDNKYDLISVYALNENQRVDFTTEGNSQNFKNGNSNLYSIEYDNKKAVSNANSVLINTTGKRLNQGDTMDIYVVYRLKTPTSALASLLKGTKTIPTYNMAEIYEYKTYTTNNNEATRGLLDKDSAPGSVGTEKVRLITTESDGIQTTTGTPSTVEYYFNKQNLSNLKYEDDTYATPTLYFTSDANGRKLSGTVFEDYTVIYGDDRIKSGNGIQDAQNGEPGINGVTVELVEGNIVRYKVTTKTDEVTGEKGTYTFENFLPGNYTIRYSYGDTNETFIAKAPNTKSYNGEDFQSTNNTGKLGNKDKDQIATLNPTPNYWYVFNEKRGVSTAKDDTNQRNKVSDKVVGFTDLQMQVLNNARDGKQDATVTGYIDEESDKEVTVTSQEIMEDTKMFATTPNFTLSVEKTTGVDENKKPITNKTFNDDYTVTNMNFGIAEVPVTTIDLQKSIKTFTIMDSANQNTIAKITKDGQYSVTLNPNRITDNKKPVIIKGLSSILKISEKNIESDLEQKYDHVLVKDNVTDDEIKALRNWMNEYSISEGIKITHGWKVEAGNVTAPAGATKITAQIEDAKLQGARLEITYDIIASMYTEKNFDNSEPTVPNITGIIDYIDNDLSYNETLGRNKDYWKLSNYTEASGKYASAKYECIRDDKKVTVIPKGTLDPKGTSYTTIVKAKEGNPLLLTDVGISEPVEITLEKTLSSQDSTIMDIITSSIDTYEYDNQLEITGLNYENTTSENGKIYRDRVRNPERYIILAGSQHDTFHSETLSIFPPTGENRSINYYIIAFISLGVLTIGIIVIKKFVIKRK